MTLRSKRVGEGRREYQGVAAIVVEGIRKPKTAAQNRKVLKAEPLGEEASWHGAVLTPHLVNRRHGPIYAALHKRP